MFIMEKRFYRFGSIATEALYVPYAFAALLFNKEYPGPGYSSDGQ